MRPKLCEQDTKALQLGLDDTLLKNFINLTHPLVRLAEAIDWTRFDLYFGEQFKSKKGRPALPTRLIVGLHYLKHMENLSDEEVVARLTENPYWQYFCGFEVFQKRPPCDATTLVKWRKKFKIDGAEILLQETLATAHHLGLLKAESVQEVYVDTTVQEKNVTYPTDAKLLVKLREGLFSNLCN
ncbi:MAG: transposase [Bdellovibrionaceae bacterium]|nr:transposase [Pseudobdellovibrionaceae bacterium]